MNSRLTPIILALIFIPIAVFAGVLFANLEKTVVRENTDAMEARITSEYDRIETNVESVNMCTRFFLSDEGLLEVLRQAADGSEMDMMEMLEFHSSKISDLERLVNNNPLLYAVRVYSVTDDVQEMVPILYSGSRMQRLDWYGEDPEGWHFDYHDTLFSSLLSDQGNALVSRVTAVSDYDRGVIGYVESAMTMETMFRGTYENGAAEWGFLSTPEGQILSEDREEEARMIREAFDTPESEAVREVRYRKLGGSYYIIARYPVKVMDTVVYAVRDISREIRDVYFRRNLFVLIMTFVLVLAAVLIDRMIRNYQKQVLSKNAELRSLQNQINAHFIYNVLESIKMMAEIDEKYEISDAITSLGKLMRYSIKWSHNSVPLEDELEYIRNYVLLMNLRNDFEVILSINVPEELLDQEILKMSLQPIVENAVVHGIEPVAADTTVYIKAWSENDTFRIELTDSGKGMNPEELEQLMRRIRGEVEERDPGSSQNGNGVGLKNVEDRIKLTFGSEYGLEVYSEPMKYTKVSIRLPRRELKRKGLS